jgi:hypothetical protein
VADPGRAFEQEPPPLDGDLVLAGVEEARRPGVLEVLELGRILEVVEEPDPPGSASS